MTAAELITALQAMPPDAMVFHIWDGEPRTEVAHVWLARSGHVMTADSDQVVYTAEFRPVDAPVEGHWSTPK